MTSRFISDEGQWPVVIQIAQGLQDLGLHEKMLAAWDSWFARQDSVVVLRIYRDAASLEHAPGVAKVTKAWMQAGAAENIRRYISAMPIVVPPENYASMADIDVDRVFGVPGGIFAEFDAALAWLSARGQTVPDKSWIERLIAGL